MYNIPGIPTSQHLKLSGDVLAQIYIGKVTDWNDAKITALNLDVKLLHKPIVVVRRSGGSGNTFLFTQFLSDTSSAWKNGPAFGTRAKSVEKEIRLLFKNWQTTLTVFAMWVSVG